MFLYSWEDLWNRACISIHVPLLGCTLFRSCSRVFSMPSYRYRGSHFIIIPGPHTSRKSINKTVDVCLCAACSTGWGRVEGGGRADVCGGAGPQQQVLQSQHLQPESPESTAQCMQTWRHQRRARSATRREAVGIWREAPHTEEGQGEGGGAGQHPRAQLLGTVNKEKEPSRSARRYTDAGARSEGNNR